MSELGDEPHDDKPPLSSSQAKEVARRVIQGDRVRRLQILDYLWKVKRKGERGGSSSDGEIMKMLGTSDKAEVKFHLDTLADHGLIDIGSKTTGGYSFIEITGGGTSGIEDFFLQIDDAFRTSGNIELETQIKQIDEVDDVYLKHDRYIATMSTVGKGFEFGNGILRALGLA